MKKAKRSKSSATGFVLFLYCVVMLWLLLGQRLYLGAVEDLGVPIWERCNFQPFKTILWYLNLHTITSDVYLLAHGWINLIGNVVLFVPLGYLLPRTFPNMRKFWKVFLWVTASVALVEGLQLVTRLGSCDIDDLILNLFGAVAGYLIWRIKTK